MKSSLIIIIAFSVFSIKQAKPIETVQFDIQALQDYADNLETHLPEIDAVEIFDNTNFADRFADFVKTTIEREVESEGSGTHKVDLEIDIAPIVNEKMSWFGKIWRQIKFYVTCPFRWLWNKAKSTGFHLAVKFDGAMADFQEWKRNFRLSDYIPKTIQFMGDVDVAFIRIVQS